LSEGLSAAIMGAGIPVNSRAIGWPKILLTNDQNVVDRGGRENRVYARKQQNNHLAMREKAYYQANYRKKQCCHKIN